MIQARAATIAGLVLAALILAAPRHLRAQGVKHTVQKGETPASLSAHYYGSRRHGKLIMLANGLKPVDRLNRGAQVLIPSARPHIVSRTASYEALALKLLGGSHRWSAFKKLNRRVSRRRRVARGQQIWVPFVFSHKVGKEASWAGLASAYLGTSRAGKDLAAYNGQEDRPPRPGTTILIPASNLHLTRARLVQLLNQRVLGVSGGAPLTGPGGDKVALGKARALLREGAFSAVALELLRQLGQLLPRARDRAEVFRLAGTALVALERPDLAHRAFAEMLRHQPNLRLESKSTSPKVQEAVRAAAAIAP